ncbi:golgi-body localization protein domain-containing protein [Cristinia sonorae]|uniref:Golgi-body localization protein domain-containing protein n=1 Tax=Cristinia sonorae TaxID=1940300 RepID=A0A8K0UVQ3_9AGAR|nr:golgi-body localization protein domain-containing protein [Cristinia sonorae]
MTSSFLSFTFTSLTLLFRTLLIGSASGSLWITIVIWAVRLVTLSLLFRTILGPFILRLISKRLTVRSVSLRSIRGISFRSKAGIWRVDRIGLSFQRRSRQAIGSVGRFAIKVEGVKLELEPDCAEGRRTFTGQNKSVFPAKPLPSAFRNRVTSVVRSIYLYAHRTLDPYLRPTVRTFVLTFFRVIIRTLPALVQALDFELESAVVTYASEVEAAFSIARAKLDLNVSLIHLGLPHPSKGPPRQAARHNRFASVANLNTRLRDSLKRTWERAWGGTEVIASSRLDVSRILVTTQRLNEIRCLDIPNVVLSVAARLDPHKGVQQHSLEISLKMDPITVDVDAIIPLLEDIKKQTRSNGRLDTETLPLSPMSPVSTPASPNTPFAAVRSVSPPPISPMSIFKRPTSPTPSISSFTSWRSSMGGALSVSTLKSVHLGIPKIIIKHRFNTVGRADTVRTTLDGITMNVSRSHPDLNPLHREYLGRSSAPEDPFTADIYSASFSIQGTTMTRLSSGTIREHLRVMTVGTFSAEAIISQWPSPWLRGPTFLGGDPNDQWLLLRVNLAHIEVSEHLEVLQSLLNRVDSAEERVTGGATSLLPPILSPIPRLQLSIGVGTICARLISPASLGTNKPFAIEARTEGFVADLRTEFIHHTGQKLHHAALHDYPRTRMQLNLEILLQRTFVNVCGSQWEDIPAAPGLPAGQPLLSLDEVHITGSGSGLGELVESPSATVSLDVSSLFMDVTATSEALSIELWQPDAIGAISTVIQVFSASPRSPPVINSAPKFILDSLPTGFSLSVALSRAMVFITGPDLSPGEELEISRGVASHIGIALTYCYLRPSHKDTARCHPSQEQQRLLLSLPSTLVAKAHGKIANVVNEQSPAAMIQIKTWDIAFRDAIATRLVADDLFGVGDTHHHYRQQEYLNLGGIVADILLSGQRHNNAPLPNSKDHCAIVLTIAPITGTLHLANIYNALLAVQTVKSLIHSSITVMAHRPSPKVVPTLAVSTTCELTRVQLIYDCPLSSKVYLRLDTLFTEISPSKTIVVNWSSLILATLIETERNGRKRSTWEEVARLLDWRTVVQPDLSPVGIVIDGHSASIRLPFQFVLADLILNLNVSMKCVKHLLRMVPSGRFSTPPIPEAEEAKKMPDLVVRIGRLCVEASDEDIESQLALIWRVGADAARLRMERDDAFQAKVAAIAGSNSLNTLHGHDSDYQFSAEHTVSIEEARDRLRSVHSGAWKSHLRQAQAAQDQRQESICPKRHPTLYKGNFMVHINPPPSTPPLFRIACDGLSLHISRPSFPLPDIPDFLHTQGGIPVGTEYSLLIPMHLGLSVSSLRIALREYPLPLISIPSHSQQDIPGLIFDTDLVIAEEMVLSEKGVEWVECAIVKAHRGIHGASPLSIVVPKTLNPVKTYANPIVRVTTDKVTDLTWGVAYSPAMQDFMRVVDTLSHAPRDSSPAIGFWDKLRLIFHWSVKVHFNDEVHLHLKGSRNPYELRDNGAGFALCWKGHPQILLGQPNEQNELIQVISDSMLITVPDDNTTQGSTSKPSSSSHIPRAKREYRKVVAKLSSGVRFGIGFVLERACGSECPTCIGTAFQRQHRLFTFKPHYEVMMEKKTRVPPLKSPDDSYNGFRSDFIHMSISLTSSTASSNVRKFSSIHLSPGLFAHFFAWWSLFGTISLPIRQGRRYQQKRPLSPKFGQHLATIKYRISIPKLFISHAYLDQSTDAWADGVTPFVGSKAMIDQFQADMHQRAQEATITTPDGKTKTIMHKPFSAIEVVLKGLQLRALLAIFSEPLKKAVPLECSPIGSAYRNRENIPVVEPNSPWIDLDDFVETDWSSSGVPILHLLPVVSCPRFTYFRHASPATAKENRVEVSKFDNEDTHVCLLGTEASVPQVQLDIVNKRLNELRAQRDQEKRGRTNHTTFENKTDIGRMITLLEDYANHLAEIAATSRQHGPHSYYMPSDSVSPEEWAEFQNVYQVHCPQIFMDNITRDILIQYYYCSVARRGIEYHMATRAVKFIRDQAQAAVEILEAAEEKHTSEKHTSVASGAQAAALAVRKMFFDKGSETTVESTDEPLQMATDPMSGWEEGVSLRKSHFCLLLKPQIVLRSETSAENVLILAAVHGKLQTYGIMDIVNADDPVSGKVMTRNFASITGLQSFSPSAANTSGEGCVPLEVLVDLRCDNSLFNRLVPQTNASLHYDKFNRLRLRNNVTSAARSAHHSDPKYNYLLSQTDLIRFHVPRFTVSANDRHFQAISNIVTDLLLFSNAALKTRSERLEKMLFSYDFTNVSSAADVVADLQSRLRHAVEMKREADWKLLRYGEEGEVERLKIYAHILLLSEELTYVFDAIKLAQDKVNNRTGQNSALLLHASSSEISWRMLDRMDQLLAKLAVREIDFHWLSRQDSSVVNNLAVGDMQAFDGAADAEWTEILSKFEEKSNHPLVKQKLFLLADWTVLPPVGGITIYEMFDLNFHPMCLQIDTRVGKKIMEYVWPARRIRKELVNEPEEITPVNGPPSPTLHVSPVTPRATASMDIPSPTRRSMDSNRLTPNPLRRLAASRSFTDLRADRSETRSDTLQVHRPLMRTKSSDGLFALTMSSPLLGNPPSQLSEESSNRVGSPKQANDDAAEMKTRSSQKTFVWVRVSSLHLVLSILKEDSFLCRDARIRTRDLEYRNQTWSFEELVDQFIPSGRNWKGWVKMAFQQPLVPVLPVARELITKTKWGAPKTTQSQADTVKRKGGPKRLPFVGHRDVATSSGVPNMGHTPSSSDGSAENAATETEAARDEEERRKRPRARVLSLFKRSRSKPRGSMDSDAPPGRVSSHIMSSAPVPTSSISDDKSEHRRAGSSLLSGARHSISGRSHHSRHSMISLEGPSENVLIPADEGHEPGRIGSALSVHSEVSEGSYDEHHHDDIVEHLDVIDPQIATVSMLTNAGNSLVIPPLSFYSRKPVVVLSPVPRSTAGADAEKGDVYEDNLDRHVEDVLRKRDRFRRVMRGVWSFLKTRECPVSHSSLRLLVFWGAGIVLFLAKIINLHNEVTQGFWVELCQQVETGLFTATSIGLIPFRALDTFRICKIWWYKRKTRKLRAQAGLPQLYDEDDLPDPVYDENYVHVLSEAEQADLHYQQYKFSQSQTWYRPHGTQTHRAFPISIALTIAILNDLNSFFQILLSACMWSMNRFERPAWTTATTLPAAFVAGILAGVYIWWGGKKTKRNEAVEKRLRHALAMESPRPGANPVIKVTGDGESTQPPTADSSPLVPQTGPRCQDFALSDATAHAPHYPPEHQKSLPPTPRTTTVSSPPISPRMESVASIPISDSMTVPPASALHNGVRKR